MRSIRGDTIPESISSFFESRLGHDFSNVRLHVSPEASQSARIMGAQAYTIGNHIVFGKGQFQPTSQEGQRLLAHELTHVVQQRASAASMVQRSPAEDLIDEHTSWYGNLDEGTLGAALLREASASRYGFVNDVLNELAWRNRDDVSLELLTSATDTDLDRFAQSNAGKRLLDRLFDELTEGSVGDDEAQQADRIMKTKAKLIPADQFPQDPQDVKIFPHRLPGLTVFNDAPINAERRGQGKIWVEMPVRVLGTSTFRDETRTLPDEVFTSGIELPENEIIGVKMYDLGGEIHYRPALYLIQLSNEADATVLQKMGEAAGLGLTLGTGALLGLGFRAGMAARVLLWADRAAFAIGTITSVIREHRGWIIERYGQAGRDFLGYVDLVNSAVLIYGGARVVIDMGRTVSGMRSSYRAWRDVTRDIDDQLSNTERGVIRQVNEQTDEFLDNATQIKSAQEAPVPDEAAGGAPRSPGLVDDVSRPGATIDDAVGGAGSGPVIAPGGFTSRDSDTILSIVRKGNFWEHGEYRVYITDADQLVGTHSSLLKFRSMNPEYAGWHSHHIVEEVHLANLGVESAFPPRNGLPCVLLPPEAHSGRIGSILRRADNINLQPEDLYGYYEDAYALVGNYTGSDPAAELLAIVRSMLDLPQ